MKKKILNIFNCLFRNPATWVVLMTALMMQPIGLFTQSLEDSEEYEFPKRQRTVMEILFGITYMESGTEIAKSKEKDGVAKKELKVLKDTVETGNKLEIRQDEAGEIFYVYLTLKNPEQRVEVGVFNMLGKQVMEIFSGDYKSFSNPYVLDSTFLPNGLFLCVAQGKNFRLAEKFIVSH